MLCRYLSAQEAVANYSGHKYSGEFIALIVILFPNTCKLKHTHTCKQPKTPAHVNANLLTHANSHKHQHM